jgi:hypothetical protein
VFSKGITIFSFFIIIFVGDISLQVAASRVLANESSTVENLTGIYAINTIQSNGHGNQINPAILRNRNVDGVGIEVLWSNLETADRTYNWAKQLDSLIAQAALANKKVILRLTPGYATPAWVFAEGAQYLKIVWDKKWGRALCSRVPIPLPWDPIYQEKWMELIEAVGARFGSNLTVVGVEITGINGETDETILNFPSKETITNGSTSCTGYNYVAYWQAAGYTRTLIEHAWLNFAQTYQQAFPRAKLIAIMGPYGLPPIDQFGNIIPKVGSDKMGVQEIIAEGIADFPDQFVLENNGLSKKLYWDLQSYANQVPTGYQTTSALGAKLSAGMNQAIGAGAVYLELYPPDVLNPSLAAEIAAARRLLLAN